MILAWLVVVRFVAVRVVFVLLDVVCQSRGFLLLVVAIVDAIVFCSCVLCCCFCFLVALPRGANSDS